MRSTCTTLRKMAGCASTSGSVPVLGDRPNQPSSSFNFPKPRQSATVKEEPGTGKNETCQHTVRPQGVQFLSNAIVKVTGSSYLQVVLWEKRGFCMYIPSEALGESEEREIAISTSHSGCFNIPDGTFPVSFVYYVEPSGPFHKPVTLEIEHCCNPNTTSTDDLVFGFAKCSSKVPPYTFQSLDGCEFFKVSSYGQIEISSFSLFGILSKWNNNIEYWAHIFCRRFSRTMWRVAFVVTERLTECLRAVLDDYTEWREIDRQIPLNFKETNEELAIVIPKEGATVGIDGSWKLCPLSAPLKIKKSDIHSTAPRDRGYTSVRCTMILEWLKEGTPKTSMNHSVDLEGLERPQSFRIIIDPEEPEPQPSKQTGHGSSTGGYSGSVVSNGITEELIPVEVLTVKNFWLVKTAVFKARRKWREIGTELGLSPEDLDDFEKEGKDCGEQLSLMLRAWLQRRSQQPSWHKLIRALKADAVGREDIACNIGQKYLKPQSTGAQP